MTQIFATNEDNDIYIGKDGNLAIFRDLPAVLQACEHAAKAILGEMVLAVDQGIPYFETVWNGVPNYQQFSAALRAAFLGIDGVIEVVSLTISQNDDIVNYIAVIRTVYGNGEITNG
jgi:hypothetical protein